MKIIFEERMWLEARAKIESLYDFERDFQYKTERESEFFRKARKIIKMKYKSL